MSGTGTSSRTSALPYSCMRAAFISASFPALRAKWPILTSTVGNGQSVVGECCDGFTRCWLTILYGKPPSPHKRRQSAAPLLDGVFAAPIAHFVPCLPGPSLWMAALGGQERLLQPRQLQCPAQRFRRLLRQRRRCSRQT